MFLTIRINRRGEACAQEINHKSWNPTSNQRHKGKIIKYNHLRNQDAVHPTRKHSSVFMRLAIPTRPLPSMQSSLYRHRHLKMIDVQFTSFSLSIKFHGNKQPL